VTRPVAADATLSYLDAFSGQLVWLDRLRRKLAGADPPAQGMYYPRSPDGRRAAVEAMENGSLDVWVHDLPAARGRV
jgi:hypothetical protein